MRAGCVCFGCKAWLCDKFFAFRLIRDFGQFCVALENFALCMIKDFEHWLKSWWLLSQHHKKIIASKILPPPNKIFCKISTNCAKLWLDFAQNLRKDFDKIRFYITKPPPKSKKTIK